MSKSGLTAIVSTTREVSLKPALRRKLLNELHVWNELHEQKKAIQQAMDSHVGKIEAIRDEVGEKKLALEGFKIARVEGITTRLDQLKLIAQGVTTAQIEAATITKPKKAYTKITPPGTRDEGEE